MARSQARAHGIIIPPCGWGVTASLCLSEVHCPNSVLHLTSERLPTYGIKPTTRGGPEVARTWNSTTSSSRKRRSAWGRFTADWIVRGKPEVDGSHMTRCVCADVCGRFHAEFTAKRCSARTLRLLAGRARNDARTTPGIFPMADRQTRLHSADSDIQMISWRTSRTNPDGQAHIQTLIKQIDIQTNSQQDI